MALSKGWKIALSIVAVMGVLFVLGVGAIFYWVKTRGRDFIEGQMASATKYIDEGNQYGLETDNAGCVKTTLARLSKDDRITALLAHRFFLKGCLPASKPTAGFCDGVPPKSEMVQSLKWRMQACAKYGSTSPHCGSMLEEIQEHCATTGKERTKEAEQPAATP